MDRCQNRCRFFFLDSGLGQLFEFVAPGLPIGRYEQLAQRMSCGSPVDFRQR